MSEEVLIVGIVFFSIYKVIELLVFQRSRKHLIDKMSQFSPEALQSNLSSFQVAMNEKNRGNGFSPLRWGTLALGVGLGWLIGEMVYLIQYNYAEYRSMGQESAIISTIAICAGISLIVVYFIERKALKKEQYL
jgi:hypothetical protein